LLLVYIDGVVVKVSTGILAFVTILMSLAASVSSEAATACTDPLSLSNGVVKIVRGTWGTGFFLSATRLATVEHVVDWLNITRNNPKEISLIRDELRNDLPMPREEKVRARLHEYVRTGLPEERIAVIELATPFQGARALPIRSAPLRTEESVAAIGYTASVLRKATGTFHSIARTNDGYSKPRGSILFEMQDGDDRRAINHGSSGGPVFDCEGNVVAAIASGVQTPQYVDGKAVREFLPPGNPTIAAVSVANLKWSPN